MAHDPLLLHALFDRARRGDAGAFDDLVRHCDRGVVELAWRLLWNRDDAEDVRQQAWLKAWLGLGTFGERASFTTWLYRIVVNLCRDRLRAPRRLAAAGEPDRRSVQLVADESGPLHALTHAELRGEVVAALLALPGDERECVVLRHYHDLTTAAIAEIVGRPRTTIQSCLERGLKRLAFRLRHYAASPPEVLPEALP